MTLPPHRRRSAIFEPTTVLAATLIADLLLVRIGAHIVDFDRRYELLSIFIVHLAGLLALAIDVFGTLGLILDRKLFTRPARFWFALVGATFLPLCAASLFVALPPPLVPQLHASFGLGIIGLAVGAATGRATRSQKIAMWVLVAPVALQSVWLFLEHAPALGWTTGRRYEFLYRAGQWFALVAAPLAAILFGRGPLLDRLRGWPIRVAIVVALALLVTLRYPQSFDRLLAWGFDLAVPDSMVARLAIALLVIALSAFMTNLFIRKAPGDASGRIFALGLLIVVSAGFLLRMPHQMLAMHVGFLVLMRGLVWPRAPEVNLSPERWEAFVRAAAAVLGAGEPIVLTDDAMIVTRIRRQEPLPLDVRIVRRGGEVREVGVTVGIAPATSPPFTAGGAVHPPGVRLPRGADATEYASEMPRLLEDGWLGVWPKEAVVFRAFPEAACTLGPVSLAAIAAEDDPNVTTTPLLDLVRAIEAIAQRAEVRA